MQSVSVDLKQAYGTKYMSRTGSRCKTRLAFSLRAQALIPSPLFTTWHRSSCPQPPRSRPSTSAVLPSFHPHTAPATQHWRPVQRHAASPPPPRVIRVRWTPPRPGWYKLNFDGSVLHDGSGRASIGGAIRDGAGRVVAAFAERTAHAPIGVVEARALVRGLRLAEDSGFITRLLVEGDDLTLVRLLRGESRQTRISRDMEDDILELLGRFRGGCEVQHVYREGNRVADALCHEAHRCPGVWIDRTVPFRVYEKVEDDRHGVAHDRVLHV